MEGGVVMVVYNVVSETAISLPFRLDARGNVVKTSDPTKLWADRVRSAVGTLKGERLFQSNYGSEVPRHTMDPIRTIEELIYQDVSQVFTQHLPSLRLKDVLTTTDEISGSLEIEVLYELPTEETVRTQIGFASVSGAGPVSETPL